LRDLLSAAILAWGDASPVKFVENEQLVDFEIRVQASTQCTANGCVLASAFFPDAGQHSLLIYPSMFEQSPKERVDTLIHEI